MGSPSTGGRTGGDPHELVEEGDPHQRVEEGDPHQRVEEGDPHQRVEEGDPSHHELEMGICSSVMEMKSKISITIKTGFRPL